MASVTDPTATARALASGHSPPSCMLYPLPGVKREWLGGFGGLAALQGLITGAHPPSIVERLQACLKFSCVDGYHPGSSTGPDWPPHGRVQFEVTASPANRTASVLEAQFNGCAVHTQNSSGQCQRGSDSLPLGMKGHCQQVRLPRDAD